MKHIIKIVYIIIIALLLSCVPNYVKITIHSEVNKLQAEHTINGHKQISKSLDTTFIIESPYHYDISITTLYPDQSTTIVIYKDLNIVDSKSAINDTAQQSINLYGTIR